jgi:hypothetical protein
MSSIASSINCYITLEKPILMLYNVLNVVEETRPNE